LGEGGASPFTPHSNKKPCSFLRSNTLGWRSEWGQFGAPGVHCPLSRSFQRADSARQSGPILQPQEVEATAAVDQSARTEGGLAEGLLPAGQTLSPQLGTSGFPRPQNCP
jgi:hypothetical protein